MPEPDREEITTEGQLQQMRKHSGGEDPAEPPEPGRHSDTAKDVNVVRGDDRPQSVRHGG